MRNDNKTKKKCWHIKLIISILHRETSRIFAENLKRKGMDKQAYKDYGEINAADEELIQTRILRNDMPVVAFCVKTGDENKYEILSGYPLMTAEITIKKDEEYSDEVELGPGDLRLKFRLKDCEGRRKSGFYWVYNAKKMSEIEQSISMLLDTVYGEKRAMTTN